MGHCGGARRVSTWERVGSAPRSYRSATGRRLWAARSRHTAHRISKLERDWTDDAVVADRVPVRPRCCFTGRTFRVDIRQPCPRQEPPTGHREYKAIDWLLQAYAWSVTVPENELKLHVFSVFGPVGGSWEVTGSGDHLLRAVRVWSDTALHSSAGLFADAGRIPPSSPTRSTTCSLASWEVLRSGKA